MINCENCEKEMKCPNCHEHFFRLRPLIKEIIISKQFKHCPEGFDTSLVLDCKHEYFTRLHKFERKIKENYIFRAVYDEKHLVYAIDDSFNLIFLRVFSNFKEYKKFIDDDKKILDALISI
jgi:hypothetical protein